MRDLIRNIIIEIKIMLITVYIVSILKVLRRIRSIPSTNIPINISRGHVNPRMKRAMIDENCNVTRVRSSS